MATLTPISVGNTATPSGWDTATNGDLGDNSDSTFGDVTTNASGNYDQGWALDNVDSDLGNMDTLSVVLRRAWGASPSANTTWDGLEIRIVNGATILAAADAGGTFAVVDASIGAGVTSPADSSAYSFDSSGYLNTSANKATWDGATVEIRIVRTRVKGGSSDSQRVHEADFTGTYTVGASTVVKDVIRRGVIPAPR